MADPFFGMTGEKGEQQQRELSREQMRVAVPDFLRPLLDQFIGAQAGLTQNVATNAQRGDRVPYLTPDQTMAESMARRFATGEDGSLSTVQDFFGDAMSGQGLQDFSDPAALNRMYQSIAGVGLNQQLPGGGAYALEGTARGDNLYGGPGFDASVKAAVDAALPSISSAFGGTRGGLSGALAKESVGRAGVNEALRYQDNEKSRQLAAQDLLGRLTGETRRESLGAAGNLLDMSNRERDRSFTAASALPSLSMLGPEILSRYGATRFENEAARRRQPFDDQLQALAVMQRNFPWQTLLGQDRTGETTADAESSSKGSSLGFG